MGIERGQAATHQVASTAQRPAAAGKAAASGDFLALMAALEDGAGLLQGDALALLSGDNPGSGKAGKRGLAEPDVPLPDPAAADLAPLLPGVPLAVAVPQVEAAPALPAPVAAAGAVAAVASAGSELRQAGDGPVPGPAARAAPAETGPAGSAAVPTAPAQPVGPAPVATAAAPAALAATGAAGADPRLVPEYASVFEQLRQHLAAREAATPESALRPAATPGGVATALREPLRAERAALPSASAVRAEALAVQDLAAAAGGASARSDGQDTQGSGAGQPGTPHPTVAWAGPEFTPTVQYDAALGGLDAALQPDGTLDRQLADQLRQWASQGVRSAELTVGTSEPVQVRIALDGNEAQVQFRAEHAATREMLSGTVDQLRELLGAQGLVLSGVSVGAHGGPGSGGERGPAGQDAASSGTPQRQGQAAAAEPVAATAPRRSAGTLDLYV